MVECLHELRKQKGGKMIEAAREIKTGNIYSEDNGGQKVRVLTTEYNGAGVRGVLGYQACESYDAFGMSSLYYRTDEESAFRKRFSEVAG